MRALELKEIIDFQFSICKDMIEDNGEDSFFHDVNNNYAIVSAFDGCGGLGSKEYSNFSNKTGAYVASRVASGATAEWFLNLNNNALNPNDYKKALDSGFSVADAYADKGGIVFKGSMQKAFPTTVSTIVTSAKERMLTLNFLWAGDSRGYILDADGLHQITDDDINGEDAMSNLSNDGVLTNVASFDNPYEIHSRRVVLKKPSVVFSATDGCFGYLSTPMEFEYLLLETLLMSDSPLGWQQKLYDAIGMYAGDDYTLSLQSVGYNGFETLKRHLYNRYEYLKSVYINGIETKTYEEKLGLWNHYRLGYEYN